MIVLRLLTTYIKKVWNGQKSLNIAFISQRIMRMTAIISAMWIRPPRLKAKNPRSHKIKRIIPIINNIPISPFPFFEVGCLFYSENHLTDNPDFCHRFSNLLQNPRCFTGRCQLKASGRAWPLITLIVLSFFQLGVIF